MSHAGQVLVWAMMASALARPALAQQGPAVPPVLSTEASPPAGARAEPAQMSGYPLQVGDLPPGIVAIRVIRESFQTNVPNETVLLRVGNSDQVLSGITNAEGRVQFDGLQVGERVRVRATVGTEVLESQRFEIPTQGGVRMVLVAGVGAGAASSVDPWPPAVARSQPTVSPRSPSAQGPSSPAVAPSTATQAPLTARDSTDWLRLGLVAAVGILCGIAGTLLIRRRPGTRAPEPHDDDAVRPGRGQAQAAAIAATATPRERREALFAALIHLETGHKSGGVGGQAYSTRREALIDQLVELDVSLETPLPEP